MLTEAEQEEIAHELQERLDNSRYWAYVDRHTGGIFSRWRAREEDDNRARRIEVDTI